MKRTYQVCLGLLILIAGFYMLRHYSVKAYSDPLNWLRYALDFKHSFLTSKWPFGYPAFLKLMLPLTGRLGIFLINIPVLFALYFALARVGVLALGVPREERPMWTIVFLAGLIAAAPDQVVHLVAPYRDPFAHLLLALGSLIFIRFCVTPSASAAPLAGAGFLIGFACCVRETSVLMVGPLFLGGVVAWWSHRERGFWKPAMLFGAGFALGIALLFVQSYLETGEILVAPQTAKQKTLVPGMHLHVFWATGAKSWAMLKLRYGVVGLLFAGLGMLATVLKRRWLFVVTWGGALVTYYIFYCFYYTYVARYFYLPYLFLSPFMVMGAVYAAQYVLKARMNGGRFAALVMIGATSLVALDFLSVHQPAARPFQIPQALEFRTQLTQAVPEENAIVFAERNLCELIEYLGPRTSYPLLGLLKGEPVVDDRFIPERLPALLAERPVYVATFTREKAHQVSKQALERYYDLVPVADLANHPLRLDSILGRGNIHLFRVQPWSQTTNEIFLPPPAHPVVGLRLFGGRLKALYPERTGTKVYLNDVLIHDHLEDARPYLPIPKELDVSRGAHLRWKSDAPLPQTPFAAWIYANSGLMFHFGLGSSPPDEVLLDPSWEKLPLNQLDHRPLCREARIRLPGLWPPEARYSASLRTESVRKESGISYTFEARFVGGPPLIRSLPLDRSPRDFGLEGPGQVPPGEDLVLEIRTYFTPEQETHLRAQAWFDESLIDAFLTIDLDLLLLHVVLPGDALKVDIGAGADKPYLVSGFYDRESFSGAPVRWTQAKGVFLLPLEPSSPMHLLRVQGFYNRAEQIPPAKVRLFFNQKPIEFQTEEMDNGAFTLTAPLPSGLLVSGDNILTLESDPWSPKDYGLKDARALGVMINTLEIVPAHNAPE